jgi:phage portal protein BeeE
LQLIPNWLRRSNDEPKTISLSDWATMFSYNSFGFTLPIQQTLVGDKVQEPPSNFLGFADFLYKGNGVVFACMDVRKRVFSQARFQWRQYTGGKKGQLFGTQDLTPLEEPWTNGTTGSLLSRAISDVDLAGNFYARRVGEYLERLRPDWVTILCATRQTEIVDKRLPLDLELAGYIYTPGGPASGEDPVLLLPEEICHWAPTPDPCARYRGMSWLTPVLREVMGDQAMTEHQLKFFENGASPNLVVSLDPAIKLETFQKWIELFKDQHEGVDNAYKTLFLGGGAEAHVVGSTLRQADFRDTRGHGETRVAAAAGVPPIIVGLSEGLEAATYSNYGQARRAFADITLRFLWRDFAAQIQGLLTVPPGAQLEVVDEEVSFLQEDRKDAAEIEQAQSITVKTLIDAGFEPASAVEAVTSGDFSRLTHSGLVSVQLQPPGQGSEPGAAGAPSSNGAGNQPAGVP